MASNKMLSQQDILRFRNEIQSELGYYDPKVHSKLFSERVHRHLDHQMESIGVQSSDKLKRNLIQQTIVNGKADVTLEDLKRCCTDLQVHVPWKIKSAQRKAQNHKTMKSFALSLGILFLLFIGSHTLSKTQIETANKSISAPMPSIRPLFVVHHSIANDVFTYQQINHPKFMHYLTQKRGGLIGQPKHYYKVVLLAKENDIDPLLLFAIIGQEQSFVPSSIQGANKIINNPFNVFHSWQNFNTNLSESTLIAINTIKNRLATCPKDHDPFVWLNGIYAEDPNWHIGVKAFYHDFQTNYSVADDKHAIPPILNRVQ